MIDQP